ncbi:hypothetical protein AAFP30_13970 [Gordonia sp. CPCC 205515]|uniref:hypothetical protein n=1 Tax=Gordonia sp. CPCC 205515 TaxID=3140791 RepID=UPI003AF3ED5E
MTSSSEFVDDDAADRASATEDQRPHRRSVLSGGFAIRTAVVVMSRGYPATDPARQRIG